MSDEFVFPQDEDVRFVVRARKLSVPFYKAWWGESVREERVPGGFMFLWDRWDRKGEPFPFVASFDLSPDPAGGVTQLGPLDSPEDGDPGYREVRFWQVGLTGFGPSEAVDDWPAVDRIQGVTVEFEADGQGRKVTIGVTFADQVIGVVLLVASILLLALLTASLF